jgi:L-tyrosine isonitrile synthase
VESPTSHESRAVAARVLGVMMAYQRRSTASGCASADSPCPECLARHLPLVEAFVREGKPVVFVLPAFPGKSPNRAKVLGPLPDMAEQLSLSFLHSLCDDIEAFYPPGARLLICSDGRVFNDLVRIPDEDITGYQRELRTLIEQRELGRLALFNLEDEFGARDFDEMRHLLVERYGEPLESLRAEVRAGGEPLSLYRGITRFLLEDAMGLEPGRSKASLLKECRVRSYGVIQRSKAWGALVTERYPHAVRLSIHPQPCGSEKLGIHLMETADNWLTPWHGAAVKINGRFVLMKRRQAEELGATLVFHQGRPSHFTAPELGTHPHSLPFGPRAAGPGRAAEPLAAHDAVVRNNALGGNPPCL